jgi:hypothetical protein
MVKGRPLHLGILVDLTLHLNLLIFFKKMKYVGCLPSLWKEKCRLGIGNYQPNIFIDGTVHGSFHSCTR